MVQRNIHQSGTSSDDPKEVKKMYKMLLGLRDASAAGQFAPIIFLGGLELVQFNVYVNVC